MIIPKPTLQMLDRLPLPGGWILSPDKKSLQKEKLQTKVLPVILHTFQQDYYIWGLLALTDGSWITMPPMNKVQITSLGSIKEGISNISTLDCMPTADVVEFCVLEPNVIFTIAKFLLDDLIDRGHL